jgi:hypothetical protein
MTVIKFPYGTSEGRDAKAAQESAGGIPVSNVFEVPTDRQLTDSEWAELHSRAFRDLESEVCNLHRWAELAGRLILQCACDRRSWRELELAVLVVKRLSGLAGDFRDRYYLRWKNELPEDCS